MSHDIRQRFTNVCAQLGEIIYKIHREEKSLQAAQEELRKRADLRDRLLADLRDIEVEFVTVMKSQPKDGNADVEPAK